MPITKEERMKIRRILLYLADCMIAVNDMEQMNNCNNCGKRATCAFCPKLGTPVRWNCVHWIPAAKKNAPACGPDCCDIE